MKRIILFIIFSSLIISCSTTKRLSREKKADNVTVSYDIITILTADGVEKEVYFDISRFFGKFK